MPTQPFLQELDQVNGPMWQPDAETIKEKAEDEEIINEALRQRSRHEERWLWAASRWNLLNEPIDDPNLSNVLLPFIRMIGATAISSLSEAHRKNIYKPRQRSDDAKAMLWQSASDHVDDACGMQQELDDFYTNFVVLGTAALEDYKHLPHITRRKRGKDGWEYESMRDFTRPRIGTRSRSSWSFGFWAGNRDPNVATPVFTRDYFTYNHFIQEFANVYLPNGQKKYENCQFVLPGKQCLISSDGGTTEYETMDHQGVSVFTFQDPLRDIFRIYANGIRICNISLRDYIKTQKTTIAIAQNNHQYDGSLRESSAYGMGEPHLLQGLDALYQAIGNLNIDNYKLANTNLINVRNTGGAAALDQDIDFLSGVRVDGDVVVSPLGSVRLGEYQAFKEMLDKWAIWTTKVNFQQLVGETSKTAFELQQRIRASAAGTEYKMKKLAGSCFRKHAQNRLAFILSEMTVEEYLNLDVAEIPRVQELIKANKVAKEDYLYENGKPVKRVMRERVKVKNRDIVEELDNGKRTLDTLRDKGPAEKDSEVAVVPEYFWSSEYIESGGIPDIEVEVDLGTERDLRFQKTQFLANYGRQRIAEAAQNPQIEALQTNFDGRKIDEEVVRSIEGIPKDSVMSTGGQDEEIEKIEELIQETEKTLSPLSNAQSSPVVAGIQNVDAGGLGSLGGEPQSAASPLAAAETAALGAA